MNKIDKAINRNLLILYLPYVRTSTVVGSGHHTNSVRNNIKNLKDMIIPQLSKN